MLSPVQLGPTSYVLGLLCTSLLASLGVSAEDAALFQNQSLMGTEYSIISKYVIYIFSFYLHSDLLVYINITVPGLS